MGYGAITSACRNRNFGSPLTIPQLLSPMVWLTAAPAYCFTDDGVTQAGVGDSIKRWTNRGSLGGYFEQGNSGERPTLRQANGKYVVRGTAAQYMSSSGITITGEATLSVVAGNCVTVNNSGGYGYFGSGSNTLSNHTDTNLYDSFGTDTRKSCGAGPNWANWIRYVVTTKAGEWTCRAGGSQLFTTATNTVGWSATQQVLRGNFNNFQGDICELVIYPALTADQITAVEAYMSTISP